MQKQLCFGLGIALFCVAAVLYYCANNGNSFDLRTVGEAEALTVNGGGETGTTCQFLTPQCGKSQPLPCMATSGYTTSSTIGDQKPSEPYHCGAASCGDYSPSKVTVAE
jgi:hypothetical protein